MTESRQQSDDQPCPRREFLRTAGAASAGLVGGLAGESAFGFVANDTLNVACIGTGGRCRHLMNSLREIPHVRIAAVCDIYDLHLVNWVECVRSRKTPNAPAEAGVSAASAAHLGNIAYRQSKVAQWETDRG